MPIGRGVLMKKIFLSLILFSVVLLNAKTWVREYTYNASEADSKLTSRAISLEQVKRLLLQEIGVYVHSTILNEEVEVSGELKELTAKQIEIISAGITETKIIEESWNGETYYIKAEITADENDVIKRLDKVIEDKEKTKQLEDSRRKTEKALAEIERLKQRLAQTQDENEKLIIQSKYNKSSNELTAEDWFQKGYNAAEIGEYDNAILYYQKSIEINPGKANPYYNMGVNYQKKKNYNKAIELYRKVIEIDSYYADAYYNMGIAHTKKENYDEAIVCFQKSIELNPENTDAYYNLGVTYGDKGNYDEAIECFQKAIDINPEYATYYNLGVTYDDKGNYDKAIECYRKAIEINPDNAKAYYNMGVAYHKNGNYHKATEYYKKAARLGLKEAQELLRELEMSW